MCSFSDLFLIIVLFIHMYTCLLPEEMHFADRPNMEARGYDLYHVDDEADW